jgi:hypothetical protein
MGQLFKASALLRLMRVLAYFRRLIRCGFMDVTAEFYWQQLPGSFFSLKHTFERMRSNL